MSLILIYIECPYIILVIKCPSMQVIIHPHRTVTMYAEVWLVDKVGQMTEAREEDIGGDEYTYLHVYRYHLARSSHVIEQYD